MFFLYHFYIYQRIHSIYAWQFECFFSIHLYSVKRVEVYVQIPLQQCIWVSAFKLFV